MESVSPFEQRSTDDSNTFGERVVDAAEQFVKAFKKIIEPLVKWIRENVEVVIAQILPFAIYFEKIINRYKPNVISTRATNSGRFRAYRIRAG